MCVCERERWNQVCVCVCLCVMESGMCVYDRIKYVCVCERERWNQVCVCLCDMESSMYVYVCEREKESSVLTVLQRMEPLLTWPWLRMSRGWFAGFPQGEGKVQALEGPSCSTEPMCTVSQRSFLGSGLNQSGCMEDLFFPRGMPRPEPWGICVCKPNLGNSELHLEGSCPVFPLIVRKHPEHKNVWSGCSSNNELISGF